MLMSLSNNHYTLGRIDSSNLEECAKLLSTSFLAQNKVWGVVKPSWEQTYRFMRDKTAEMLEWEEELRQEGVMPKQAFLNYVYLDRKGDVVVVFTGLELTQYLRKKSKVSFPPFDILESYGHTLQKSICTKDLIPGLCIYGVFSAAKGELSGEGIASLFWLQWANHAYSQGFRILYARSSSLRSYLGVVSTGGFGTAKVKVMENGQQITLSFIKWFTDPIAYTGDYARMFQRKVKL